MPRWIQTLLVILLGLAVGLFYGWRVAPVEYTDIAPNSLHEDYQSEYILMVAESYQSDKNLDLAVRHIALLGNKNPIEIITKSLAQHDYTLGEKEFLESLLVDLQLWRGSSQESAQ